MINITFPDGSVRQFDKGVSGLEIAKSLSNSLAREVLSVNVNEELWDLGRPVPSANRLLPVLDPPKYGPVELIPVKHGAPKDF